MLKSEALMLRKSSLHLLIEELKVGWSMIYVQIMILFGTIRCEKLVICYKDLIFGWCSIVEHNHCINFAYLILLCGLEAPKYIITLVFVLH